MIDYHNTKQLILGRPWIYGHQCLLDFAQLRIRFSIGANQINVPMMKIAENDKRQSPLPQQLLSQHKSNAKENGVVRLPQQPSLQQPTPGLPKDKSDVSKANAEERQSSRPRKTHRKRRQKGKGRNVDTIQQPPSLQQQPPKPKEVQPDAPKAIQKEQDYSRSNRVIWLPKQRLSTASTEPLPPIAIPRQPKNTSKSTRQKASRKRKTNRFGGFPTMQIWVPKTLLQMQGYYDGNAYIWLPKNKLLHQQWQTSRQSPERRYRQPSMAQTQEPKIVRSGYQRHLFRQMLLLRS